MKRYYYRDTISGFINEDHDKIIGKLTNSSEFSVEQPQRRAWQQQIIILQGILKDFNGVIFFEYSIPRMGRRADVILIIESLIFVLEFKVNSESYYRADIEQVWDYALDLKNFHETSHNLFILPCLIATDAKPKPIHIKKSPHGDRTFLPVKANSQTLIEVLHQALYQIKDTNIDTDMWEDGRYCPTPTIIEAATALYAEHSVEDLSRNDAGAINLGRTSKKLCEIIQESKTKKKKSICFVTGVPGAGKTLVGLDIATKHFEQDSELYSVFLSGNGPLVLVLREALVRDLVKRKKERGKSTTKKKESSKVKAFIQNVHNFRDECLLKKDEPPIEHVVLFDEAQRAWNKRQTINFMSRRKGVDNFQMSEPDFLISCMDRFQDWAVIVCLVGGGQEINTGEAGISEWLKSVKDKYQDWEIWLSDQLKDSEYQTEEIIRMLSDRGNVNYDQDLHLSVSLRSFRAENVSLLVKQILDIERDAAQDTLKDIENYPIYITRSLYDAKMWLKSTARGSERYGMVVSSQAERLKPYAIDVRPQINPIHYFLNDKEDVRSSYYLEDVATEFHVQGLELDWTCVVWDGDLRFSDEGWKYRSFKGTKWQQIKKQERKQYLKNAYRVLLTRARQGMVIVVPKGDKKDHTRLPEYYDPTYNYLRNIGLMELPTIANS